MSDNTITLQATAAVNAVETILALLEKGGMIAASVSNPIGLGVSAAAALIPLIQQLTAAKVYTVDQQVALQGRVLSIIAGELFKQPQWQPRPESPDFIKS